MSRARIAPVLTLVLLAALLLGAAACNKDSTTELPDDLLALLPAEPAVMVSLSSLDDYEARRAALADSSDAPPLLDGGALARIDLAAMLAEMLPAASALLDGSRPLAMAVGAPAPMTNQLDMVLLLPLVADAEPGDLTDGDKFQSQLVQGGYVALSAQPGYAAQDSVPALARDRLPGLVSVAVDLEQILTMYRPFIEMGLAAMAAAPPADPDNPQGGPAMTPEQAAATAELMRLVMDSSRRMDLSADLDAEELVLDSRFDMVPGSALVPGPQPDFGRALALSGSLPADAHLKMALAVDQTQHLHLSMKSYHASMAADLHKLQPEAAEAVAAWLDGYEDTVRYLSVPMGVALGAGLEGIEARIVAETTEGDAFLDHMDNQLGILSGLGAGLTVTPMEPLDLAGVMVRGWDLTWDDMLLAAVVATAEATDTAPTGGQLAQTMGLLRRLTPGLRAFATEGKVVVTTDTGWDEVGLVLADVRDPRSPDRQLAELAAAAGPGTQEAIQGNLGLILVWFMEAVGVGDEAMLADLRENSLEITTTMTMEGPRAGSTLTVGVQGLRRTVQALDTLGEQMRGQ